MRSCVAVVRADFSSEPFILARTGPKGLSFEAVLRETAVRFEVPGNHPEVSIAFPASLLSKMEGHGNELVNLEERQPGEGRVSWSVNGRASVLDFPTLRPKQTEPHPGFPPMPARSVNPGEYFQLALNEASITSSKSYSNRFAGKIQLRGKPGQVVATDSRQLLVQSGFKFPWIEDLMVAGLGIWDSRELGDGPVAVGGAAKEYVFVRIGGWSFALTIDTTMRFPAVEQVIPPPASIKTRLRLNMEILALLKNQLPHMLVPKDESVPLNLDIGKEVTVTVQGKDKLELPGAEVQGKPVSVNMDGRMLLRLARLGFLEIEIASATTPLCCRLPTRTFVWMPTGEPESSTSRSQPRADRPTVPVAHVSPEEKPTMPDNNSKHTGNGDAAPNGNGFTDPLVESEAIRGLLTEAQNRMARLIASLKHFRKQSRAVRAAVQSLQQLPPLAPYALVRSPELRKEKTS